MQALLNQPAVQGGLAPFLAALIIAELFRRLRLSGLAVIAAFVVTVYLINAFGFEPLTAARKIILLGVASTLLAVALGFFNVVWLRTILAAVGGLAALWMAQRILLHQSTYMGLVWGAACMFYTGWLVFKLDELHDTPVRAGSAGLALGFGTGLSSLFGGSALLAMYGLSIGAAAGAFLLIQVLTNRHLPCGRSFTLPLGLIAGLTACLGVLSSKLPWYALIPLALVPLAARMQISERHGLWLQSILLSSAGLACSAVSVYLTWRVAGAPPF